MILANDLKYHSKHDESYHDEISRVRWIVTFDYVLCLLDSV